MEIGRTDTDFYATMILRDFFLWMWRGLGGLIFLALLGFIGAGYTGLSIGLYLLAAALVVTFAGAYLFMQMKRVVH